MSLTWELDVIRAATLGNSAGCSGRVTCFDGVGFLGMSFERGFWSAFAVSTLMSESRQQ